MYSVLISKTAAKGYSKLPKELQQKCKNILQKLSENPNLGKGLVGKLSHYSSIRLTNYRIIYQKKEKELVILVVSIRHRKEVYKKME